MGRTGNDQAKSQDMNRPNRTADQGKHQQEGKAKGNILGIVGMDANGLCKLGMAAVANASSGYHEAGKRQR